jgi:hypothetical protein
MYPNSWVSGMSEEHEKENGSFLSNRQIYIPSDTIAKMVAMAGYNDKENKTKMGYSAHKGRRRSFTVDALDRLFELF